MMKSIICSFCFAILSLLLSSCSKSDDGPSEEDRQKMAFEERHNKILNNIVGTWENTMYRDDKFDRWREHDYLWGGTIPDAYTFNADGSYTHYKYYYNYKNMKATLDKTNVETGTYQIRKYKCFYTKSWETILSLKESGYTYESEFSLYFMTIYGTEYLMIGSYNTLYETSSTHDAFKKRL